MIKKKSIIRLHELEKNQNIQMQHSNNSNDDQNENLQNQSNSEENNQNNNLQSQQYKKLTQQILQSIQQEIQHKIIQKQFLDINEAYDIQQNHNNDNQNSSIRQTERQQIIDFIQSTPLKSEINHFSFTKSLTSESIQKKNVLKKFNEFLLNPNHIKFLNIFGPPGTGKTYTLKSLIKNYQNNNLFIWKNGMTLMEGKIKKLTNIFKDKFQHIIWQRYKQQKAKFPHKNQFKSVYKFDKNKQKILLIDEFDQILKLDLTHLLRFLYIRELNKDQTVELFFISKIIIISNNYFALNENLLIDHQRQYGNFYIEKIIFQPYQDKYIYQIIEDKIKKINKNFLLYLNQLSENKNIFPKNIKDVFSTKNIKYIINKVCHPEQKDLRKVFKFYRSAFNKWLQNLKLNYINNINNNNDDDDVDVKKITKISKKEISLISELQLEKYFLANESKNQQINFNINKQINDESNQVLFYLINLEEQGRIILKSIYHTVNKKKRLNFHINHFQKNQQKKHPNKQNHSNSHQSSLSTNKNNKNLISLSDFYRNISSLVDIDRIYPWIYEWKSVGILKIYQNSNYSKEQKHLLKLRNIGMSQDFIIQLKQQELVKKVLIK